LKFEKTFLEAELMPEYKEELLKVDKGKFEKFSCVKQLRGALKDLQHHDDIYRR